MVQFCRGIIVNNSSTDKRYYLFGTQEWSGDGAYPEISNGDFAYWFNAFGNNTSYDRYFYAMPAK